MTVFFAVYLYFFTFTYLKYCLFECCQLTVVIAAKNNIFALFHFLSFPFSHIAPVLQVITLLVMVPVTVPLFHVKMPSSHVTGARKLLPLQIYPLWILLLLSQLITSPLTVALHSPTSLSPFSPFSSTIIKKVTSKLKFSD